MTTMHTNKIDVIVPYSDLQAVVGQYLRFAGAVQEDQLITSVIMPIEINDEDMVEISVGLLQEGNVN